MEKNLQARAVFPNFRAQNFQFIIKTVENGLFESFQNKKQNKFYKDLQFNHPVQMNQYTREIEETFSSKQHLTIFTHLKQLTQKYFKKSNPVDSPYYLAHMNKQHTIPSILGSFFGNFYENNNCGFQTSPVTQQIQIQCFEQFSKLFSFPKVVDCEQFNQNKQSWGHFTSGGTIANFQALWAVRSVKFIPLIIKNLIFTDNKYQNFPQYLQSLNENNFFKKIDKMSFWQLMNLKNEEIFSLLDWTLNYLLKQNKNQSQTIQDNNEIKKKNYQSLKNDIKKNGIQNLGIFEFYTSLKQFHPLQKINQPIIICSSAKHYSIIKSFSALGFGTNNIVSVGLSNDCRMDIQQLNILLQDCLRKKIPIFSVIAIIGSTQHSSIDNLKEILNLRQIYQQKGLYFSIHCDAAFGGFFRSLLINSSEESINKHSLSNFVQQQLKQLQHADSITFDPHKNFYNVLGIGGIIYKNHKMKNFINFSANYVINHSNEPNLYLYGLEGSKSGALVSSVYLNIKCIPLNNYGLGSILEKCLMKTKILYAKILSMFDQNSQFKATMNSQSYNQRAQMKNSIQIQKQIKSLKIIANSSSKQIYSWMTTANPQIKEMFSKYYLESGPDLNILVYGFNFKTQSNKVCFNKSLKKFNSFQQQLIKRCQPDINVESNQQMPLFLSRTIIYYSKETSKVYQSFLNRANLMDDIQIQSQKKIILIRSSIKNPFFIKQCPEDKDILNQVLKNLQEQLKKVLNYLFKSRINLNLQDEKGQQQQLSIQRIQRKIEQELVEEKKVLVD